MSIAKFWMVWVVGNTGPRHQHRSIESARREAERLASECTESPVVVLEVVGVAQKSRPPVEWGEVSAPAVSGPPGEDGDEDDDSEEMAF